MEYIKVYSYTEDTYSKDRFIEEFGEDIYNILKKEEPIRIGKWSLLGQESRSIIAIKQ